MNHQAYRTARFYRTIAFVALGLGLANASCTSDDSANHVLSEPAVPDETFLFDNFELVTAPGAAPANGVPSFSANHWYKYDDHSLDLPDGGPADAAKPMGQHVVAAEALPEPHPTINGQSASALHIYGGTFTGWGAGVTGGLSGDGNATYDASAYSGIIFWAKKGPNGTSTSLTVALPSANDSLMEGGVCHDPETPGKHDRCSDAFHKDIILTPNWKLYVVLFDDFKQEGWGYKPLGGLDKRVLLGSAFSNKGVSSKGGDPFDEWIDDVAFFN
jgi:hypothetical protein